MLTYLDNILLTEGHLHKQRVADVAGVHQLHYVLRQCLARLLTSSATSGVDFNRQQIS